MRAPCKVGFPPPTSPARSSDPGMSMHEEARGLGLSRGSECPEVNGYARAKAWPETGQNAWPRLRLMHDSICIRATISGGYGYQTIHGNCAYECGVCPCRSDACGAAKLSKAGQVLVAANSKVKGRDKEEGQQAGGG